PESGADLLHSDAWAGPFVPNPPLAPAIVKACRPHSRLPFDCHLMIEQPQLYIERFLEAGADMISVHVEAEPHLERALQLIRDGGGKGGGAPQPPPPRGAVGRGRQVCAPRSVMTRRPRPGGPE